ncbi:MAG: response regulator [Acidobacteria bacterium]|nr:response regulator [Acidobacteriota bacterium]
MNLQPLAPTGGRVVVIDDEEPVRNYLSDVLTLDGYLCKCFAESRAALAYLSENSPPPDLVLTDIYMPGMDGLELMKRVHAISPGTPVILISGIYEMAIALEAVKAGAADYLFKPAGPAEVLSLVAKHIHPKAQPGRDAVERALRKFLRSYETKSLPDQHGAAHMEPAIELFQALGFKRYETMQHSLRVAAYAGLLGRRCGLLPCQLRDLELGAMLHDIGKIAVPRNVLLKPEPLDEREWEVMRTHPSIGFELLAALPQMQEAVQVVYAHHERYDGTGYPHGLRGEEIPLFARLFSIVDTLDAITYDRPYRRAQGFDAARREILKGSGTQFDPRLVRIFLEVSDAELNSIRARYPEL